MILRLPGKRSHVAPTRRKQLLCLVATKTNSPGLRESRPCAAHGSECYFEIFSWRPTYTKCFITNAPEERTAQIYGNLAYILDKNVLWDELEEGDVRARNILAFAKHPANLIRSFHVGSYETEMCAFTHEHTSRDEMAGFMNLLPLAILPFTRVPATRASN